MNPLPDLRFRARRRAGLRISLLATLLAGFGLELAAASITPVRLRCESLDNPLGIDAPQPRLSWQLEVAESGPSERRGVRQSAYRIRAASTAVRLAHEDPDLWDSGWVTSAQSIHIPYAGRALALRERCFWQVRIMDETGERSAWSAPAQWTMGWIEPVGWPARWITSMATNRLPLFRTSFQVTKPVARAELAICGLGFHETHFNGEPLDDAVLEPGWTNYRKTCLYRVHDLTDRLTPGENVLGVMLGNGMYNVTGGRYVKFTGSFGPPKLTASLDIEYTDGSTDRVSTDARWQTAPGPITFSCIFGGEDYDARREIPGWDRPGFDTGNWSPVVECDGPGGRLSTRSSTPIKVQETFTPVAITEPKPGIWIYDLGQNFSGWPRIEVIGPSGSTVKLVTGELLDENGLVSQRSSGSPVWFAYTLKGDGTETWEPRFSYTGFRYVQVEGAAPAAEGRADSALPRVSRLEGRFLYPDAEVVGAFACSNPDVNRVHALILSAIKSNFKSVLTDCPHREKLGWLECSHLLAGCFMYNFDCARFYAKIANDMAEAQLENGLVPDIAPEYVEFQGGFRDSPEWGSACVIAPWRAWRMYGDRRVLESQYETMQRYVDYLGSRATDHIVSHGLGDWYDIGPRGPGPSQLTSLGLTATGVYYQDLEILRRVAQLLGREDEARDHAASAAPVRDAFNRTFFHAETQRYDRDSQTANATPLVLGLTPPDSRDAVRDNLVRNIRNAGNRVTAGDVGFYYVVQALLEGGRSDVLYDMLCQTNGPGYLMQLDHGATSLTEAWDTNPASSQNHCMLGHIEEWFYSGLLGIRPAAPGFSEIVIKPEIVGDLTWARGHYDSPHGLIESRWTRNGDRVTFNIRIPPNTTATVHVPARPETAVTESGRPAEAGPAIRLLRREPAAAVYSLGSGRYRFESSLPKS
ncbi:MAG: family 78 glycoside hydrolase catalytic domain [Verrucomicrobiales bacterium]|nr:family 78 glycoside hydrolase catalytic domain [Verrucomicrobiales bacterium]